MGGTRQRTERGARLSHIGPRGAARMVDVGAKKPTSRSARAECWVRLGRGLASQLRRTGRTAKGAVLETARVAGIMAAKRTAELIPLCHPLPLDAVDIELELHGERVRIESSVRTRAVTGVEMEALTAVAVAALTVYDMCKAADKGIAIEGVRLLEKTGGKSGAWKAAP